MITSVDLNDEYLEGARRVLGTSSKVETINAALKSVADRPERMDLLTVLATGEGVDLDQVEDAWR